MRMNRILVPRSPSAAETISLSSIIEAMHCGRADRAPGSGNLGPKYQYSVNLAGPAGCVSQAARATCWRVGGEGVGARRLVGRQGSWQQNAAVGDKIQKKARLCRKNNR